MRIFTAFLVSLVALCCTVRADPVVPDPIQAQPQSTPVVILEVLGVALAIYWDPTLPWIGQFAETFDVITTAGSSSKDEPSTPARPSAPSATDEEPNGAGTGQ